MTPRDDDSLVGLDELVLALREHEGPPQPVTNGASRQIARAPRWRGAQRATLLGALVAVALLVGSGLGFGLGSSVTPSGTARANVVGSGFLPARDWNVVQSGVVGPSGETRSIAANVPISPIDAPRRVPLATLLSLPARGVIIVATFTTRGDPGEDFKFAISELPLRIESSRPSESVVLPERDLGQYRLRVGIGGYNVDAQIYFGTGPPSAAILAAAQIQLNRLIVASEGVTIAARPAIVPWNGRSPSTVTLFGSVDNGKAGETVEIQAKDCGQQFFRVVDGTSTVEGGGWSTEYFPGITTTLRAVWKGAASTQIKVRHRAFASLRRIRSGVFEAGTAARSSLWRRRMTIQRFDRRLGKWTTVRSVVLTEQEGGAPSTFVSFSARFRLTVPKGTQLRSVLPTSQARPCYLSGTSVPVRA